MTGKHLSRLEILDFVEGAEGAGNEAAKMHIDSCEECLRVHGQLVAVARLLNDPLTWGPLDAHEDAESATHGRTLLALEDEADQTEADARAADAFLVQLAQEPVEQWESIIGMHPHVCSSAFVQRLVDAAAPEVFRQPEHALVLLRVAESVAFALDHAASLRSRGHVWKQRANALRMRGLYEQSIDAALVAEQLHAELQQPDTPYEIGQARYTIALALFEMTQYEAALRAAASARELLAQYGMSVPLAKVMMLEALIQAEWGDVTNARETLRALLPIEKQLGQPLEVGRVRANLAECNLRLGDLDAAMDDARAAIETFRVFGNVTEETRSEWTIAMIRLARGEREAIDRLHEIAAVYRELRMPAEAGFVDLDITAELLSREEWAGAEILARELVTLFTAAGVTLASVNALHYLRHAVENREATADTIHYIRKYIAADDPSRSFEPPESESSTSIEQEPRRTTGSERELQ